MLYFSYNYCIDRRPPANRKHWPNAGLMQTDIRSMYMHNLDDTHATRQWFEPSSF